MKKIIIFAIGILTSVTIQAENKIYTDGNGLRYQYDDTATEPRKATLINGPSTSASEVAILDKFLVLIGEDNVEFTVTSIASNAFKGNTKIKFLEIPATIESIGDDAFSGCSNLIHIWCKITNPGSVIPNSLPRNDVNNMVTLYVQQGYKTTYENAPDWSTKFQDRIFEGNMSAPFKFSDDMFYICASDGVNKVATLYRGKNEKSIVVPDKINDGTDDYKVTGIDKQAFNGFSDITTITVSENVTTIGPEAFSNCSSLETIKLPASLSKIKNNAFNKCSNLIRVECQATTPPQVPDNLFSGANNNEKTLYAPNSQLGSYKSGNEGIVGWNTFTYYMGGIMTDISYNYNGVDMKFICSTESNEATLVQVSETNAEEIKVPYSIVSGLNTYIVKAIHKNAFARATSLEQLTFEDKELGDCGDNLIIGEYALNGCSKLKILILPKRLSRIGKQAFNACSNLAHVYIKNIPSYIGSSVFNGTTKTNAILYVENSEIESQELNFSHKTECANMEPFKDSGMTYVGWTEKTSGIKNAILTKGVSGSPNSELVVRTPINSYNVIAIGDNAFNGIGSYASLTVQVGIKTIGSNAFKSRTSLQTVSLPPSLTAIGDNAFNGCTGLTSISFGGVQTIGVSAFQGCAGLKNITLPSTLTFIGNKAFNGCNNLVEIENNMSYSIPFPSNVFPDDNIILYVPSNKSTYEGNGWNNNNFLHVFQGERQEDKIDPKLTYVYTNDDEEAVLLTSIAENTTVSIAKTIQTSKFITAIAKNAFLNNSLLESITFQDGCSIATIGKYAFKNCSKLNSISLPASLVTIGEYAFENNTALKSIIIPEGTLTIRQYAFKKCSNLATVTLPVNLTVLEDYAFDQCVSISTINAKMPGAQLASRNLELKEHVFSPYIVPIIFVNSGVSYYKTMEGWKKYEAYFRSGQKVEGYIDNDLTKKFRYYTGEEATQDATLIEVSVNNDATSFTIDDVFTIDSKTYKVTEIGDDAFSKISNKGNITSLTIGNNVKTIGANAFKGFTGLTNITLPASITDIAKSAFEGCTSLQSVIFSKNSNDKYNINTIGAYAFKGCKELIITLPASLTAIGDNAFENNTALVNLAIPNSVETIGASAFKGCTGLVSISLPTGLTAISNSTFENNKKLVNVTIPEGVKTIGSSAFKDCIGLTNVTLPVNLESISEYAFENNTSLASIVIPNGVKSIGMYAFSGCTNLNRVDLSSKLESIDQFAFDQCNNITTIISSVVGEDIFPFEDNVFTSNVYHKATVFVPYDSDAENETAYDNSTVPLYKAKNGWDKFENYIGGANKRETIDNVTYEYLTGPETATVIGATIDNGTVTINNTVKIDDVDYKVTSIGVSAFENNPDKKNLVKLTISEGIETIGANAFKGCSGLASLTLPEGLKEIGNSAFEGNTSLTSVLIPEVVDKIGIYAFKGCSSLNKVDLPSSLRSIGDYAFQECDNITIVNSRVDKDNIFGFDANVFTSTVYDNATVFVPIDENDNATENETVTNYKSKSGWSEFKKIIGGEKKQKTVDNVSYEYLTGPRTATVKGATIEGGVLTINGTVNIDDVDYTVTTIDESAFENNPNKGNLIKLTITEGVKTIGTNAFKGCSSLTTITLPSGLTDIYKSAFENNSSLTSLNVPEGVRTIGMYAFKGCSSLDNLDIPSTLTSIEDNAFQGCSKLTTVTSRISDENDLFTFNANVFPLTVYQKATLFVPYTEEPGKTAYDNSTIDLYKGKDGWNNFDNYIGGEKKQDKDGLLTFEYLTGPKTATLIDATNVEDADLTINGTVKFGNVTYKVKSIAESAFKNNTNKSTITNLTISENVDNIDSRAFQNFTGLKTLSLPSTLRTIGDNAFESNTSLENLVISEGVTTIGKNSFKKCSALKTIELPSTLTTIDECAFDQCTNLVTINSKITKDNIFNIEKNVFPEAIITKALVCVPYDASTEDAYTNTSITKYKEKTGWSAFTNYVGGEKKQNKVGLLTYEYLTGPKTATLIGATNVDETELTINGTVTFGNVEYKVKSIVESAFKDNTNKSKVTKLTISENIDKIDSKAFQNFTGLKTLSLPSTLRSIGDNAFESNTSLENLVISEGVTTIGKSSFKKCSALKTIELASTLTKIDENAFYDCTNIATINSKISKENIFNVEANVFPEAIITKALVCVPFDATTEDAYTNETITQYKTKTGWKEFTNYVGGEKKQDKVGLLTYEYLTGPKTATLIGATNVDDTELTINGTVSFANVEYKVTAIAESAFKDNANKSKVTKLTISENVDNIDSKAFQNFTGLKSLSLPSTLRTIGDNAFESNTSLENLVISEGVTMIGKNAFKKCSALKTIELPSTLTKIDENAFNQCSKVSTIISNIIKDALIEIETNVFMETITQSAIVCVPYDATTENVYDNPTITKYKETKGWQDFKNYVGGKLKQGKVGLLTYEYLTGPKTATLIGATNVDETDVTISGTVTFDNVEYKVTTIAESAFRDNPNKNKIEKLTISENVQTIDANAFKDCTKLNRVWLPKTLKKIDDKAFYGCKGINYVSCKSETPSALGESVFSVNTASLFVPKTSSYNIASWNKYFSYIAEGEFVDDYTDNGYTYYCINKVIESVPAKYALLIKYSNSSTDVVIPASIQKGNVTYNVTMIGKPAFSSNSKIVSITIPEFINSIEDNAFIGCSSLSVIQSKMATPVSIKDRNVFSDYSATLYIPINNKVDDYKNNGWNFSNIFVGERKEETIDGFTYIYSTGDQKAVLTKSTASSKDLKVPGSFKIGDATYKVIAIDKSVFKGNKNIVNLTISDTIEVVRAGAFQNCTNLKKVILPSTLKEIGDNAFDGCEAIGYISTKGGTPSTLGNSVFATSIKAAAKLYVPTGGAISAYKESGWKSYIDNILEGELKEVSANDMTYYCVSGPNTATLVKASTSKAEVTIEGTVKDGETTYKVTEIGSDAFSGNSKLAKVTINDDISVIGNGAFQNCANLKEVVIPASMTAINDNAFNKCDRLALVVSKMQKPCAVSDNVFPSVSAKLNIPSGTKGLYVEKGWDKYFSIILEGDVLEAKVDSMTYLYVTGSKTATLMKGTPKEKEVTIPTTVTINDVDYSVTAIEESALANASSIEILTISEGIETIGASAFKNCSNLKQLFLPSSINKIGDNAFNGCKNLTHIQSSIKVPFAISDNVFNTASYDFGTLYVPVGTDKDYKAADGWKNFSSVLEGNMSEVTIEGMTYICISNPDADKKTAKLTKGLDKTKEVKIPAKIYTGGVSYKVVSIEKSAFYGYGTLEKVIVSEGIKTIGVTAFKNCSKLKTVVLPDSLKSIGDNAFDGCSKLESVTCGSEKPLDISDNVFSVTALNVNVPTEAAVEAYKKHAVWKQFNILYSMSSISEGEDTEEVDAGTYQITTVEGENSSITTVAIVDDDNVTGAFTIPETVTLNGKSYDVSVIAPSTFLNNKNLISVSIPSTIIAIGEAAFAGCSNLHSIIVNIEEPINLSAPAAVRGMMTRSGGSSVFEGVDTETCILYVPEGSIDKYKTADVWREFKNILTIPATGISGVVITDGTPFDVYNVQGRKVKSGVTTLKGLAPGVYIVNGKKLVHK